MKRTSDAPKRTMKAYKLFVVEREHPGKLFSKYIETENERRDPITMNGWYDAEFGPVKSNGKVKGKHGGNFAKRPGYHLCEYPCAPHIGEEEDGKIKWRRENEVWAEVEMSADVDWQMEADSRAEVGKNGKIKQWSACIKDQIPVNGFYSFKTNTSACDKFNWYIAGSLRVVRLLSDEEVESINSEIGVSDLPRRPDQPFDPEEYGFEPFERLAASFGM